MKLASKILAGMFLFGTAALLRAELANGIKAVVHDSVVTYEAVESLTEQTADVLVRDYRNQPAVLKQKMDEMRNENLEKLLERELILREFKTAGYSLPEKVLDEIVRDKIRARYGDRMRLTKTLQAQGTTTEKFRQQVRENFIVEQLRIKNISSEIIISPHKIEAYYVTHTNDFKVEDEVKLRVIVLKNTTDTNAPAPCKLAHEILSRIKDGAPFAEMAGLHSEGSQRNQGGDWGWWEKTQLTKGLADIAFSLQKGKVSNVFSRSSGDDYWVYLYENSQPTLGRHYGVDGETHKQKLLEERRFEKEADLADLPTPAEFYLLLVEDAHQAHVKPLGDVRDSIEQNLLVLERTRLEKQWIEKLKRKTFVRYF